MAQLKFNNLSSQKKQNYLKLNKRVSRDSFFFSLFFSFSFPIVSKNGKSRNSKSEEQMRNFLLNFSLHDRFIDHSSDDFLFPFFLSFKLFHRYFFFLFFYY